MNDWAAGYSETSIHFYQITKRQKTQIQNICNSKLGNAIIKVYHSHSSASKVNSSLQPSNTNRSKPSLYLLNSQLPFDLPPPIHKAPYLTSSVILNIKHKWALPERLQSPEFSLSPAINTLSLTTRSKFISFPL